MPWFRLAPLCALGLLACGGRALAEGEDTGGETSTSDGGETSTSGETGETGETGGEPPPQTGEVLWHVVWDETPQDDVPVDIELDAQGNIVVAGMANAHPHFNEGMRWLAKFDAQGEHLWSYVDGADGELENLLEAEITSDDGIVVLGTTTDAGEFAPYLARFSPGGEQAWSFLPGPGRVLSAMTLDENDVVVVFGVDVGPDPMTSMPIVWRFDAADGSELDQLPLGDLGKQARRIEWAGQKSWVIGNAFGLMGQPQRKGWLARFDLGFAPEVSTEFLPAGQDMAEPAAVAVAPDGSVWVTGLAGQGMPPTSFDGWLMHFSNMGDPLQEIVLSEGSSTPQGGTDLAFDPWENLVLSGTAFDQGYVVKRAPSGDNLWVRGLELDVPLARSSVNAITLDGDANIFIAGTGAEEGAFADAVICKLAP